MDVNLPVCYRHADYDVSLGPKERKDSIGRSGTVEVGNPGSTSLAVGVVSIPVDT